MSTGNTVYIQDDMDSPSVTDLCRSSHSGLMQCPVNSVVDGNNHHHSFGKVAKKNGGRTKSLYQTGLTGVLRHDIKV